LSKKDLKTYLAGLSKKQLQHQILDLYDRFRPVKVFYDFAFNPQEDKLLEEAKFKIGKEYFPVSNRKPKKRRSVAQKLIAHFRKIEMDPALVADIMLFNIETAQAYTAEKPITQFSFYKSMHTSFSEASTFIHEQGILAHFETRLDRITEVAREQNWPNSNQFHYNVKPQ